jgi:hypothetical protein
VIKKTMMNAKLSDLFIIKFIYQCLEHGVEFYCEKENLYPASAIFKALRSGKEISIIFPNLTMMNDAMLLGKTTDLKKN